MIELKFYRHKTHKDLYLIRNGFCGGNKDTQFYCTTNNVIDAIKSVDCYDKKFMKWFEIYPDNYVEVVFKKQMEFDGYSGILSKTENIPISEFELVVLREENE